MNELTFIKERQIIEVLLMLDESLDLEEVKEERGLFKLGKEKVYNHVNWAFLIDY